MSISVDHIPAEILIGIFEIWSSQCFPAAQKTTPKIRPYQWITCTHVCRRWREIALSSPTLWQWVVPASKEWTSEVLARSRDLPLYVDFTSVDTKSEWTRQRMKASGTYDLLREQFYRIQSTKIAYYDLVSMPDPVSAPYLRLLRLVGTNPEEAGYDVIPAGADPCGFFSPDGLPNLRFLEAFKVPSGIVRPLLHPGIQVLKVVTVRPVPSIAGWLSALAELPELQFLSITLEKENAAPSGPAAWPARPLGQRGKVILPNLRQLHLLRVCNGQMVSQLVGSLSLPTACSIGVAVVIGPPSLLMLPEHLQLESLLGVLTTLRRFPGACPFPCLTLDIIQRQPPSLLSTVIRLTGPHPKLPTLAAPPPGAGASTAAPSPCLVELFIRSHFKWTELFAFFDALHDVHALEIRGHTSDITAVLDALLPVPDPASPNRSALFPAVRGIVVHNHDEFTPVHDAEAPETVSQEDRDGVQARLSALVEERKARSVDLAVRCQTSRSI